MNDSIIKYYNRQNQHFIKISNRQMGKKSKMLTEDPILKKNFKLEKRKKQREQQKQKLKQEQERQERRLQQLREIEKKVQQDIQKHFQQQKQLLMNQGLKTKLITKKNSLINAFNKKQGLKKFTAKQSTKSFQQQFTKHLPAYSIQLVQDPYAKHFQQNLPVEVTQSFYKQKRITQAMKMEQQIRQEISSMFSVKKVGEEIKENVAQNQYQKKASLDRNDMELEGALEEQQKEDEPFIMDRTAKTQTQGLVQNQIYSFSKLALSNIIENSTSNETDKHVNEVDLEYHTAEHFVNNYHDYIHVQNREEQTIQDFRKIVIKHMYTHQLNSLNALQNQLPSKGFTNSKFLILTPYLGDAKAIFDLIEEHFFFLSDSLIENEPQQQKNKKKKQLDWVVENKQKISENEDDEQDFFRVGIKILPRKKKIQYFSNFDSSDIIVASPIGLKSIINGQSGNKQNSFLSSVEVVYVDRASVIMMQNWDHLIDIFMNMNYMPKYESLKNSINEIRPHYLQLKARIYRQNLVFTEFPFPELNSLKLNHFHNWQGAVTFKSIFLPILLQNNTKIQNNFYKIELKQPKDDLQTRFQYFKRKFWDKIHNNDRMKKVIFFVNSYFEFVKLKGFLEKVNASFEAISEHTKKQKIQSRISLFNNNSYRILLLTERAYYFGVCQIKKQRHIFFYSLPKNGFIYKEMIENMQQDSEEESKIVCIYSKYDKSIVERLVGSSKAVQMVKEYCTNVSFIV